MSLAIHTMAQYLLEIGTEELPADFVPEAQNRLEQLMAQCLRDNNIGFAEITGYSTPRRLACIVKDIALKQDTVTKKVKGPPVKSAFDPSGKPLPSASGFAQKNGLTVETLQREEIAGVTYLIANLTIEGRPTKEVLAEVVPNMVLQVSGERLMRWGSGDFKFSRPIRWIVSLIDNDEAPVQIEDLRSSRYSRGHRILGHNKVEIKNADCYKQALKEACVLVDPSDRLKAIQEQVQSLAKEVGGSARQLKGGLIQEVVNITEWPSAVRGNFADEYLELPDLLIETVMVHHQRYFPIERAQNSAQLLPHFVSVANNDSKSAGDNIRQGNERVLRARLADGRFFYFDDQKQSLSERVKALSELTFQEGLGSYSDKQERLEFLAQSLAKALGLDSKTAVCLEQAVKLCKLDLVTALVRELPELQGFVGSWYAKKEGQPPDVVTAIASHYQPRFADDDIPSDIVGRFASLLDKLDTLTGVYLLGKRATGSSDPYMVRRLSLGFVDVLIDGLKDYPINLTQLMTQSAKSYAQVKGLKLDEQEKNLNDLRGLLLSRISTKLEAQGFGREIIASVLGSKDPLANVPDTLLRVSLMQEFLKTDSGIKIARAGVRLGNILKSASSQKFDAALLKEDAEKNLFQVFESEVESPWNKFGIDCPKTEANYKQLWSLLIKITQPIDDLFDKVMINDPDKAIAANRQALLQLIYGYFLCFADFPALQAVLP